MTGWEPVFGARDSVPVAYRLAVPGGWLYRVSAYNGASEAAEQVVYVPAPPAPVTYGRIVKTIRDEGQTGLLPAKRAADAVLALLGRSPE